MDMNNRKELTAEDFWKLSPYGNEPFSAGAEDLLSAIPRNPPKIEEGDYQQGGEWFCGKCHAQKSVNGGTVAATCDCFTNREREAKAAEELKARKERCFSAKKFHSCDFQDAEGNEKALNLCRTFCENWNEMQERGWGLILYGNTGTGKTWLAAAVCNEIMRKGYGARLISCGEIEMRLDAGESLGKIVEELNRFPLLVLDDYGAERETSFMHSKMLTLLDARQNSGRPMLITTNLSREQLNEESRVNSRAFDGKIPVLVSGSDKRRNNSESAVRRMQELWKASGY